LLPVLPETLLAFSALQLRVWFLCLLTGAYLLDYHQRRFHETLLTTTFLTFALLFGAMLLWLRRKPPDLFVEFKDQVLQVHRRSNFLRFQTVTLLCLLLGLSAPPPSSATTVDCRDNTPSGLSAFTAQASKDESTPRDMGGWDSDSYPIIADSGASYTITNHFNDLIDPVAFDSALSGIGKARITHRGTVKWAVLTDLGMPTIIEDRAAYYTKDAPYRLLSPQSWQTTMKQKYLESGDTEGGNDATMMLLPDGQGYVLSWDRGRKQVTASLDSQTNLPTFYSTSGYSDFKTFVSAFPAFPTIIPDDDDEEMEPTMVMTTEGKESNEDGAFTPAVLPRKVSFGSESELEQQKPAVKPDDPITYRDEDLFLSWHVKFGHAPFNQVRWLARHGIIPKKLKDCRNITCPACLYGKQKRRPWRVKGQTQRPIKKSTKPGECVSVDQLISKTKGLVAQTTGRLTKNRYEVATIFVDNFSGLDYVHVQESTSAEDTIEAKKAFERFSRERGVQIQHYHADNGIFASRGFRDEVQKCGQTISFCGVGAHHQNGIAERRIQDLSDTARTSLAYAASRNPAVTAHLWPYALRHASYVRRLLPRDGKLKSPEELFSGAQVRPTTRFLHCFGCPVYVLKSNLQGGNSQPKWDDRSRVGVYLGHSAQHAESVSLILNPKSGFVSPQFHCIYDDKFDSTRSDANFSKVWAEKAGLLNPTSEDDYLSNIPDRMEVTFEDRNDPSPSLSEEVQQKSNAANDDFDVLPMEDAGDVPENEGAADEAPQEETIPMDDWNPQPDADKNDEVAEIPAFQPPLRTTRSGRTVKRTQRLLESEMLPTLQSFLAIACHTAKVLGDLDANSLTELSKFVAYPASLADNDTMYLKEALQQPDRDEFLKAMVKEVEDHTQRGHWRVTNREEMKRKGYKHKPIMAVWSFKRKRNPFGEITKYKARLCCHGGQTIKGVHYEETFSPVVSLATFRMMLTLSLIHGWHARQIDFVLAFPQAKVKTDIYMHIPEKFKSVHGKLVIDENAAHPAKQDAVVKLIKNIYGLADASLTWHEHIKKGLHDYGFKQSDVDPCLFIKGQVLFILYVDDAVCLTPNPKDADDLIADLKQKGYILTDKGELAAYLGLQVTKHSDGTVTLKQPAFIERIIEQCKLKDARMHDTPAIEILHRDSNGEARKNDFHYRSVIGQLNYLAATTRPEIQFAVHQCAKFCEDPKLSHEKAIKRIVRYLKRTKDQGLVLHVDNSKGLECFVDADFAGGYRKEDTSNPRDLLSRCGYVVKYANCPIVWSSKLLSTLSLSSSKAEYQSLSMAMREMIFLINLMDELQNHGVKLIAEKPRIKCTVFEDNAGAIELARLPKLRPRTKHLAIQYHHFRHWTCRGINGEAPRVSVEYINTRDQQADIFTKPLPRPAFQHLRRALCGW